MLDGVGRERHSEFHQRRVQPLAPIAGAAGSGAGPRSGAARWRRTTAARGRTLRPFGAVAVRTATGRFAQASAARDGAARRRRRGWRAAAVGAPFTQTGQRLLDRQQPAGLHQPQQPDLQVEARLQRSLQIAEQIER